MKRHLNRRLSLSKSTLRRMSGSDLARAAGGLTGDGCGTATCGTCLFSNCQANCQSNNECATRWEAGTLCPAAPGTRNTGC